MKTTAANEDDDDGVLIYQHARREFEKAASSAEVEPPEGAVAHRRSARIQRLTSPTKAASSSKHSARIRRTTHPLKPNPHTLDDKTGDFWLTRYDELVKFKREFGNCNVPVVYKPNPQLGDWVQNQRRHFKNNYLSEDRIAKLNQIGFVWKILEDAWLTRYNELLEYKRTFGDCNVTFRYKQNPQLGQWVRGQRWNFKNKALSENRVAKLNQIGFLWKIKRAQDQSKRPKQENNKRESSWLAYYNELVQFKRQFGNCSVPHATNGLGSWVCDQRKYYRNKTLSPGRIAKLNEIGFNWSTCNWMRNYNKLVQYKQQFEDCNVTIKQNPQLGPWVVRQRQSFKDKSLSTDRIKKLNRLGFRWEVDKHEIWMKHYDELVQYKREFGDSNVSARYKANPTLGYWVMRQRMLFKKGVLLEDRITKLKSIGFIWKNRQGRRKIT
jgi:hypothetical protein